jgi:hypothetical protein
MSLNDTESVEPERSLPLSSHLIFHNLIVLKYSRAADRSDHAVYTIVGRSLTGIMGSIPTNSELEETKGPDP